MTTTSERWQSYWADKTSPQYAREDDDHYREYAEELRLLFPDRAPRRVLEIGCGNGALHRHLGFDSCDRYVGVDFSERMLEVFHESDPDVELVHADGASYRSNDEFDLIFSSQVAQYWSRNQLAEHLANAVTMLSTQGAVIVSGVPWSRMRFAYARGDMTGGARRSLPTALLGFGSELVRKRLGAWYDFPDLRQARRRVRAARRFLRIDPLRVPISRRGPAVTSLQPAWRRLSGPRVMPIRKPESRDGYLRQIVTDRIAGRGTGGRRPCGGSVALGSPTSAH